MKKNIFFYFSFDNTEHYPFPIDKRFCWKTARLLRGYKVFTDMISKWLDDMTLKYMKFFELPGLAPEMRFKVTPRNQGQSEQEEETPVQLLTSPDGPGNELNQHANEAELVNVPPVLVTDDYESTQSGQVSGAADQVRLQNVGFGPDSIYPIDIESDSVNIQSIQTNANGTEAPNAGEVAEVPAVNQMEIDDVSMNVNLANQDPIQGIENPNNQNQPEVHDHVPDYNNPDDFLAAFVDPNAVQRARRPVLRQPRRNLPQQDNENAQFRIEPPEIRYRRRNRRNRRNRNPRPVCIKI